MSQLYEKGIVATSSFFLVDVLSPSDLQSTGPFKVEKVECVPASFAYPTGIHLLLLMRDHPFDAATYRTSSSSSLPHDRPQSMYLRNPSPSFYSQDPHLPSVSEESS